MEATFQEKVQIGTNQSGVLQKNKAEFKKSEAIKQAEAKQYSKSIMATSGITDSQEKQQQNAVEHFRNLQVFFKQVSGHKYMFLDEDKNICKMSNLNEIFFYQSACPDILREFVPEYRCDFFLVPGRDRIDLDEEFDITRYCPTTSVSSSSYRNSSQSSLDSEMNQKDLHSLLLDEQTLHSDSQNKLDDIQELIDSQQISSSLAKKASTTEVSHQISSESVLQPQPETLHPIMTQQNQSDTHQNMTQTSEGIEGDFIEQIESKQGVTAAVADTGVIMPKVKKLKNQEQYIAKVVNMQDELVNKQAWLCRLLRKTAKINHFEKRFACLENLTLNLKHPCMMDLKMGSLAYNPLKSQKQQLKIKNSTSGSVGFRISGMEVYQTLDRRIIFRNKYWGRSIKDSEILRSLALFFYNGCCLRTNAIAAYIKKLEALKLILTQCVGYRFHSSSLLLVYDGLQADRLLQNACQLPNHGQLQKKLKNRKPTAGEDAGSAMMTIDAGVQEVVQDVLEEGIYKLKLIDFANVYTPESSHLHCSSSEGEESEASLQMRQTPDEDLIKGVSNLLSLFTALVENPQILDDYSVDGNL